MLKLLENLCNLSGAAGNEDKVRDFILNEINDFCVTKVDQNGNILAFKKGNKTPNKKVMVDAHMDEVGVIVTSVTDSGMLRFDTLGGILPESLLGSSICFENAVGIIGIKPIHLSDADERKVLPKADSLLIDIGAKDKADALNYISLGEMGTFKANFTSLSNGRFLSKAIDDRIGCALLITLLKEYSDYDFYATFTIGEELGLRGAKTATFNIEPDYAIVLEATTAADLHDAPDDQRVCTVGDGAVVSFMDNSTLYNKKLFDKAFEIAKEKSIPVQTKTKVAGGNNAGAIHLSKSGVKTITISLPCRYIHSPCSLGDIKDAKAMLDLAKGMITFFASGEI